MAPRGGKGVVGGRVSKPGQTTSGGSGRRSRPLSPRSDRARLERLAQEVPRQPLRAREEPAEGEEEEEEEEQQHHHHHHHHHHHRRSLQHPARGHAPPPKKRAPLPSAPRTGSAAAARRGTSLLGNAAEAYATSGFTAVNAPALPAPEPQTPVESGRAAVVGRPGRPRAGAPLPPAADPSASWPASPPPQLQHLQHHHHQQGRLLPHHPQEPPPQARTGAQVVVACYGSAVRIDSVLCKRLASEPARRDPVQRRADQRLNIERRSNVEALLVHVTGQVAAKPCKNCHKGHGPWTTCVVYDGQMCGSCSNCWFNASGARCTFHENNNPQPVPYQQQPQAPVAAASVSASSAQKPPPMAAALPQGHPFAPSCAPPPPPPPLAAAAAAAAAPRTVSNPASPAPTANGVDLQYFLNDIAQVRMPEATRRAILCGLHRSINISVRERYYARIEATAEELGRRIAELDHYRRTPEGILAEQAAQACAHSDHGNRSR